MKARLLIIAAAFAIAACAPKNPHKFTIQGEIKGFDGTAVFYATDEMDMGFGMETDSIEFVNGRIDYTGSVDSPKIGHLLYIDMDAMMIYILAEFIVEPGSRLNLNGDMDLPGQTKGYVSGTSTNDRFAEFQKNTRYMETTEMKTQEEMERWNRDAWRFIRNNNDNLAGVYIFCRMNQFGGGGEDTVSERALEDIATFSPQMQDHPLLAGIRDRAVTAEDDQQRMSGEFRDITGNSPEGKEFKLSETIAANRYTLLDFWASWCQPCIGELPYLREAYAEYKDKGFEIFAVSLDEDGDAWRKAIADHGMTWPQVSSLAGWDEPAAKLYGVGGIPTSFLLDRDGNIVVIDPRGDSLSEKLAELLP